MSATATPSAWRSSSPKASPPALDQGAARHARAAWSSRKAKSKALTDETREVIEDGGAEVAGRRRRRTGALGPTAFDWPGIGGLLSSPPAARLRRQQEARRDEPVRDHAVGPERPGDAEPRPSVRAQASSRPRPPSMRCLPAFSMEAAATDAGPLRLRHAGADDDGLALCPLLRGRPATPFPTEAQTAWATTC